MRMMTCSTRVMSFYKLTRKLKQDTEPLPAKLASLDLPMVLPIPWQLTMHHSQVQPNGRIQNSAPMRLPLIGQHTDTKQLAVVLHQAWYGNDHLNWGPLNHLSLARKANQSQMVSLKEVSVIVGSLQLLPLLLSSQSESTDSCTTRSTTVMVPSDSSSGSRMAGMESTLMTDYLPDLGEEASNHSLLVNP